MFSPDLAPYTYTRDELRPECASIGWLDHSQPFRSGKTPPTFRAKLTALCKIPVRLMRGFHQCQFCAQGARGNGEIHVAGLSGEVFVAPTLVEHYVEAHDYAPPDSFIAAIE